MPINSLSVSSLTRISGWSSEDNDDFDGENDDGNISFWFKMNFWFMINFWFTMNFIVIYTFI